MPCAVRLPVPLWALAVVPAEGRRRSLANYARFFSDPFLYDTIATTLWLALPVTLLNLALAVPIAFRVRLMRRQRLLTTILVVPITLGTVLVAEGLLNYLGPQGWFNRTLLTFGLISAAGEARAQLLGRLPLAPDHRLSVHLPAHAVLRHRHRSGPRAGGGDARRRARGSASAMSACRCCMPGLAITFCLSFVQAFSVFPSAVLLGAPAGPTRVISIAAYQAAFEEYDYSMASAVAMIMGFVQLVIVAAVLGAARLVLSRPRRRHERLRP